MSLVQAYITEDYILVCGDQKATLTNGTILENFVKVRKLNPTTIIGLTGTIEGNSVLFSDYINEDFTLKKQHFIECYSDIEKKIINKFNVNFEYFQFHHVFSVICGWDGHKMTGKTLFSNPDANEIKELIPEHSQYVRVVNCGLEQHYKNAERIGKIKNPHNILQFKNLFRDIIDEGVKFDSSINKNITFEKIRRVDVE